MKNLGMNLRGNYGSIKQKNKKLAISREGFVYRGVTLLNKMSDELRTEEKLNKFKVGLRKWVIENIPAKPKTKYGMIGSRITKKDEQQLLR